MLNLAEEKARMVATCEGTDRNEPSKTKYAFQRQKVSAAWQSVPSCSLSLDDISFLLPQRLDIEHYCLIVSVYFRTATEEIMARHGLITLYTLFFAPSS